MSEIMIGSSDFVRLPCETAFSLFVVSPLRCFFLFNLYNFFFFFFFFFERYDVLCMKSDELCKSALNPSGFFYPFIVLWPKTAEIITCVTDDPLRPYFMLKFSLQKTAERAKIEFAHEIPSTFEQKVPFDSTDAFSDVNWEKVVLLFLLFVCLFFFFFILFFPRFVA